MTSSPSRIATTTAPPCSGSARIRSTESIFRKEYFQAAPEDVVLSKLEWFRLGGEVSEKQRNDILGVLRIQAGTLDRSYLVDWATKLAVVDLLERAFAEAET